MTIYIVNEDGVKEEVNAYHWDPSGAHVDSENRLWMGAGSGEPIMGQLTYIAIRWDDIQTMLNIFADPSRYNSPQTESVMDASKEP